MKASQGRGAMAQRQQQQSSSSCWHSRRAHRNISAAASATGLLQQAPTAVISPLIGTQAHQLGPTCRCVPLLDPVRDRLPFAATLQIHTSSSSSSTNYLPAQQANSTSALTCISYCISGSGYFSNASSGQQQPLQPGDSVISLHGAAAFAAGPMPAPAPAPAEQQQPHSNPAWSQLVERWLQQLQQQQQPASQPAQGPSSASSAAVAPAPESGSSSSHQLVMLQLLLPSELLTGELLSHHAGHCHAVASQLPWLHPSPHSTAEGGDVSAHHGSLQAVCSSIREAEVCGLLADAGLDAPSEQQPSHPGASSSEHATATTIASSSSSSSSSSDSSADSSELAGLSSLSEQTLKRALSEVGAFCLPQQTNRLALLFGPHSSPAVSCSFGVEVFEPRHVTPLHVHTTAHELFFVLAGQGEAVFANSSSSSTGDGVLQRVVVRPGDVACFPPGVLHGIDNALDTPLACLQMMLPNEGFCELVRSGQPAGVLAASTLQRLAAAASCG